MIHLAGHKSDPLLTGQPEHGGRDRHTCIAIRNVLNLKAILDKAGLDRSTGKVPKVSLYPGSASLPNSEKFFQKWKNFSLEIWSISASKLTALYSHPY
ncbi:hypothetical protein HAX54_005934 [Datura stramonium]|uniref:Uncharacterized protein n=1 Tax=Datura stramonium TaxID=4076 RepID=A0ABS8TC58_DATST|nr:hypothetical protein [Datura stramonium]